MSYLWATTLSAVACVIEQAAILWSHMRPGSLPGGSGFASWLAAQVASYGSSLTSILSPLAQALLAAFGL